MKVLLGFTGGVDSTYLLYKVLTETTDDVTAFFLDCRSSQTDLDFPLVQHAELIVAQRVIDWLKNNTRSFNYRIIVPSEVRAGEWLTPTLMRNVAKIMPEGFDVFYTGRTIENTREHLGAKTAGWYQELFSEGGVGEMRHPLQEWNKSRPHAYAELPADLISLMVSCNDLKIIDGSVVECGKCTKCTMAKEIKARLAAGENVETIVDDQNRKRGVGKYSGLAPAPRYGHKVVPNGYIIPDKWK
jgi:hypothetical protein